MHRIAVTQNRCQTVSHTAQYYHSLLTTVNTSKNAGTDNMHRVSKNVVLLRGGEKYYIYFANNLLLFPTLSKSVNS